MATLYISEYAAIGGVAGTAAQVPQEPCLTQQTILITGTSAPSINFSANTRFVRLHTDAICSIDFGLGSASATNPALATLVTARMAANQTEYFGVTPGGNVAVIANT